MEKIIELNGKKLLLKANAMNALIYRSNFNDDIFREQAEIIKAATANQIEKIEILPVMRIVWTMAKAADKEIKPFEDWVDEIEEFPVLDILLDIVELITVNFSSKTKIKNASGAVKK